MKDEPIEALRYSNAQKADIRRRVMKAVRQAKVAGDQMDLMGDPLPDVFLEEYPAHVFEDLHFQKVQRKYQKRRANLRRCWNRMQIFAPELMIPGEPQDVLELSTAHGGMLEIARHFGHRITGTDYANFAFSETRAEGSRGFARDGADAVAARRLNDESFQRTVDDYGIEVVDGKAATWPYRAVIEAMEIPMKVFDGGKTPYPFEDKSQDVTLCFQAIEHYCHPDDWMSVVDEMCRITRNSIVLLLNGVHRELRNVAGYQESYDRFRLEMRRFDRNGFRCTATFIHWGELCGFKLTAA